MPVRGTRAGTPSSPAPAPPKMTAPPGPGLAAAPRPRAQSGVHANPGGPCAAVPLASGPHLGSPRKPEERLAGRAPSRPGPCAPPGEGADCKALCVLSEVIKNQQPPTCLSRVPGRKRGGGRAVAMSSMTPASSLTLDQPAFSGPSQGMRPSFSISFTPWPLPAVRGWVENWAPKSRRGGRRCRCLRLTPPLTCRVTQTP